MRGRKFSFDLINEHTEMIVTKYQTIILPRTSQLLFEYLLMNILIRFKITVL